MNAINYVYTESLEKQYAIYCPFKGKPYCLSSHSTSISYHDEWKNETAIAAYL